MIENIDYQKFDVLIVDDIPDNIQLLAGFLDRNSIETSYAHSGSQALSSIELKKPDLILLDIMMPDLSGFEVCKKLKMNKQTADIPVIFLTAKTDKDDIIEGLKLGAVDFITKPFNFEELISRIKTQLQLKHTKDLIIKKSELIEKQNEELYELNKTKDKLFSIIAHDLRNPFQVLIGLTQAIMDNFEFFDKPTLLEMLRQLYETSNQNYELLKNLLEWSYSQQDRIVFNPQTFVLDIFLKEKIALLQSSASKKNIRLVYQLASGIELTTDKDMLFTILRNFLSNAIKFSKAGQAVLIKAVKEAGNVVISVIDNGLGISPEGLEDIFRITKQNKTLGTEKEEGTGLGLVLCKEFSERMKAKIKIESSLGKGSTFSLLFAEL